VKAFIAQHNKPQPVRTKATKPKLVKAAAKSVATQRATVKASPSKASAKKATRSAK